MTTCNQSGCQEEATNKFRSRAGFKVPLCKKHYLEWEKYEFKRSPSMILADIGKWLIRVTGFLMLVFGVWGIGFSIFSFVSGANLSFTLDFSLTFSKLHYYTKNVLEVFGITFAIFLIGAGLLYIGFWKIEHDFW